MAPPSTRPWRLALIGSPNSGKSTLFHHLTGVKTKIANFPGVTVDHVQGQARTSAGPATLIDLPGTYTLEAYSPDEEVSLNILRGDAPGVDPPDGVLVVLDATSLSRSLPLLAEVLRLGLPTSLVLTMMDEVKARGGDVHLVRLGQRLGIPVHGIVGHRGVGIDRVRESLADPQGWPRFDATTLDENSDLFAWTDDVVRTCVCPPSARDPLTDRIDRVLLHPIAGPVSFLAVMFVFFQAMFFWSAPVMDLFEGAAVQLGEALRTVLPSGFLESLLVDGIIAGVGGVIVFLPQIAVVLLMINLLESLGYMARAAFSIDRLMAWVGLEGRCFVSLLSSYACAIPGIMAARTIPDRKNRLATILVAPFMTCSARLPVYTLLVVGFVPQTKVLGWIGLRGLVFFSLYLLGAVSAVVAAALFKRILLKGPSLPFVMELPPYRIPRPRVVLRQTWWGMRSFLKKAGTVILASSVILWVLLSFPAVDPPAELADDPAASRSYQLERSYAASVGKFLEPALEPLGFDWKIGVGLIASLAAREVVVATLAQIYSVPPEEEEDIDSLSERMMAERDPNTGEPVYTLATVLSLLVFFVYALQCISTLAAIRRETNSWSWPVFAFGYMLALAYGASFLTYRIFA